MDAVTLAISDLIYAFKIIQKQLNDLIEMEMTELIVDPTNGYTARDIIAHLAGWTDYVLEVLPVMLSSIDNQLPTVDVDARNKKALNDYQGKSALEILTQFEEKHQQILSLLQSTSPQALMLRRTQRGKIFTIKSYVVDVMQSHILEHSEQLKLWQASKLTNNINHKNNN